MLTTAQLIKDLQQANLTKCENEARLTKWEHYKRAVMQSGNRMSFVTDHFGKSYSNIKQKFHAEKIDAKFIKEAYLIIGVKICLDEVFL